MSEENGEKKEVLRTIVLLLVGFVVGFATHAYVSVTGTSDDILDDENDSEMTLSEVNKVASTTNITDNRIVSGESEKVRLQIEPTHIFNAVPNNTATDAYSISVTDQSAGNLVYISQMRLASPSWIAIREDIDGQLGNILGAGWYSEGKNSGTVELLRNTKPNTVYYVVIYKDDGNKIFDYMTDELIKEGETNILVTKFRTY